MFQMPMSSLEKGNEYLKKKLIVHVRTFTILLIALIEERNEKHLNK